MAVFDIIIFPSQEAFTTRNDRYDIKLRITGGSGSDGALNQEDLKYLLELINGISSHDESLSNLSLVGIKSGSTSAELKAEPTPGMPLLYNREVQTKAVGEIFDQKKCGKKASFGFPDDILGVLRKWTRTGIAIEISYRAKPGARPKKISVDHKKLEKAVTKPAKETKKDWIVGKVERLSKDEQLYGIKMADGAVLHCPMDESKENLYLDCYSKSLVVEVLASFPPKPPSGQWKAKKIHEIIPRKQPLPLITNPETITEFDLDSIPGIVKPRNPQISAFCIDNLLSGLTPEDADSLSDFLKEYRGQ